MMTDDIVARLRERSGKYDLYDWHSDIELEAADEIERLKKLLEQRDIFIFTNGLWPKFVGMLWEKRND
jgi:hypothetical protein